MGYKTSDTPEKGSIATTDLVDIENAAGEPQHWTGQTVLDTIEGKVTYEQLSTNSDVGTGADQVAQGDHNHDSTYSQQVSKPIVTTYSSPTAGTTHTFDTATVWFEVIVTGGGSSGSRNTAGNFWSGCAGGTVLATLDKTAASATIVVGAGGAETSGTTILAGASSSFTDGTATLTATAGTGPFVSGEGSGGDINLTGGHGHASNSTENTNQLTIGGASYWGGGIFTIDGQTPPPGSGGVGSGAVTANASAGGDGIVVIKEYK